MNKLPTGGLTPRANNGYRGKRYTGSFGQPDGFGSVLYVEVKQDGRLVLKLHFKPGTDSAPHFWAVELDNAQRNDLASWIGEYQPTFWEEVGESPLPSPGTTPGAK